MERPVYISLQDVAVAYAREGEIRPVLQHIDIQIGHQEMIAVLGSNGSGKSTLLQVIAGLLPVSYGTVERAETGIVPIVFQNPDAQIVGETVLEDICFGLENIAVPADQIHLRARRALAAVGLEGFEERPIEQLSGGQKQLVCIASAIAMDPAIFILDEPTAMLDSEAKKQVMQILQRLHRDGKTVIWATQSMDEVGYASRVLALQSGQLVFAGEPVEFFYGGMDEDNDKTPCRALGYHPPYEIEVVQQLHHRGLLLEEKPVGIEACIEAVNRVCRF